MEEASDEIARRYNRPGTGASRFQYVSFLPRKRRRDRKGERNVETSFSRDGQVGCDFSLTYETAHRLIRRNRSAFAITETELKLIAAAAIIGLSNQPKTGYKMPAASGTPRAL